MNPKLSICIPTLHSRAKFLAKLYEILRPQVQGMPVEILVETDNGKIATGKKRNTLYQRASGMYICSVDDDDRVADNYVELILEAIDKPLPPHCVGIVGEMTTNGKDPRKFIHSVRYGKWYEKDGVYYRNPNHLNPLQAYIAKRVPFPEVSFGEDHAFSKSLLRRDLVRNEVFIPETIYYYDYRTK